MGTPERRPRRDASPVGDILGRYMRTSGLKQKLRSPEIYHCWPEVAGLEASQHSRIVGFNNCILYVEVDSAPWLHLLATFQKPALLQSLGQVLTGVCVKDIKFKVGHGAASETSERKTCQQHHNPPPPTTPATSRSSPA